MPFPTHLKNYIVAHLRRIGYLNIHRNQAFRDARVERGKYQCAACKQLFKLKETDGDHIDPVIDPHTGFTTWDSYIERLFLGRIQVLCKPCHKAKTSAENKIRWEEVG